MSVLFCMAQVAVVAEAAACTPDPLISPNPSQSPAPVIATPFFAVSAASINPVLIAMWSSSSQFSSFLLTKLNSSSPC
jgi:hypothetical protein